MKQLHKNVSVTDFPATLIFIGVLVTTFGASSCVARSNTSLESPSQLAIPLSVDTATRSVTPNDLIALRDIGGYMGTISVSPDGAWVAFQLQQGDAATDRYRTGWFVASTTSNSGEPMSLGHGGEPLLYGEATGRINGARFDMQARWSPDSEWIAYRIKRDGEVQLWRSRVDGSVQEQLTHNAANVMDFAWSADGDRLFFEVGQSREELQNALQREGENGYLFDERFLVGYSTQPVYVDSTQGDVVNQDPVIGLWVYDLQRKKERLATDEDKAAYAARTASSTSLSIDEDRSVSNVVTNSESGAIGWLENEDPQTFAGPIPPLVLHAVDAQGTEARCDAPECTAAFLFSRTMWSPSGSEIYFVRWEGVNFLQRGLYAWNPDTNALRTILITNDWITNCQLAIDQLICLHESPMTPRKIVAIDPSDGSMKTVIDPNPEFQHLKFTRVEKLEWKEASGAEAAGHLVYPVGYEVGKRYPLVIVQYRSWGFLRGGTGNEHPIHPLAANGFFVLSFDRPNLPDIGATIGDVYERERESWGEDLWERSSALSALEIMVDQLDERGLVDLARVGITGLSDGAETVWYSMIHSTRFAAAATSEGGWSPSWYYLFNRSMREGYVKRSAELLPPGMGSDARWRRISPQFHAERIDTPILVLVSDHELVWSTSGIGALMDAGKPIEAYVYPDEYHIKWHPKHKLSVYERSIDWFNFWLRGVEDSDTEKVDQYERWHKLRERHSANLAAKGKEYTLPLPESVTTGAANNDSDSGRKTRTDD